MFERLNTPEEIFSYKLGSALTMEKDTLAMLGDLEKSARRPELKALLAEHAEETRQQITMVEQCFALLGEKVDDSPCAVTKALAAEAKANLKKTDDTLVDAVILAGALETEYHEQAVYEMLLIHARARGAVPVVALLEASLGMEQSAGAKVKALAERIAVDGVAVPEEGMKGGVKAGIVAGVAATVGVAAAAASKVAEHRAEGAAQAAAADSLQHGTGARTAPVTGVTEPGHVAEPGVSTVTPGVTPGAEEFNDDALEQRIAESEDRATH
jgi:ferritin-like metal-binding protein YciE